MMAAQTNRDHYSYPILDNGTSFYHHENDNNEPQRHYDSESFRPNTTTIERGKKEISFLKRILIVDDDPDITLTFKVGLEEYYYHYDDKRRFEVHTYNNPVVAVREFKPNFYDLLLTDIYMQGMNGFELCEKVLELDANVRVCFISSAEINIEALREVYAKVSFGCFMKKPVTIEYLAKRLNAELD
jgi:CheY-like chemotaxis protein